MSGGGVTWAGLTYGETERLLASMQGVPPETIRTRFRKLRLRPFPDEIRSGLGVRVVYDLPRVLALSAVFELNRLFLPQGHAVDMVERNWPEWARAFVAAAVGMEIIDRPKAMPVEAGSVVRLRPDAYADVFGPCEPESGSVPGASSDDAGTLPAMIVHAARTVATLAGVPGIDGVGLGEGFRQLEAAFGWTPPVTPRRWSVEGMSRGRRGFLDEGPYFDRAVGLLEANPLDFDGEQQPARRAALTATLRYLEEPAPIDRWKSEVGDDERKPRLGHLLNFWARANGLPVAKPYPRTLEGVEEKDVQALALAYVSGARRSGAG